MSKLVGLIAVQIKPDLTLLNAALANVKKQYVRFSPNAHVYNQLTGKAVTFTRTSVCARGQWKQAYRSARMQVNALRYSMNRGILVDFPIARFQSSSDLETKACELLDERDCDGWYTWQSTERRVRWLEIKTGWSVKSELERAKVAGYEY